MVDRAPPVLGPVLATDFPDPTQRSHLLAFDPSGTRFAVAHATDEEVDHVLVFDLPTGRTVARLPDLNYVCSLEFLSTDVLLVVSWYRCFLIDLRGGQRDQVWPVENGCAYGATVSADGRILAVGDNDDLVLYDLADRKVLRRLAALSYIAPRDPVFSPGGRYVATYMVHNTWGYLIAVWDARDGRRQRVFETGQCSRPLAFHGDTLTLAVDGGPGVLLYEPDGGEEPTAELSINGGASAVRFRDRGRTLEVLAGGGDILYLEARTGQVVRQVQPPAGRKLSNAVAGADWSRFAATTEGGVVVWDAPGGAYSQSSSNSSSSS
jgi:hypothetical protein